MSRTTYDVKETYTGTGSLDEYTFDFKIEALTQLLVIEYDDSGVETQRVRGDDAVYLDSVAFDAVDGGGTVTLAANLTADYTLVLLLANDSPTQAYEFRNKGSFTLKRIELALDFLAGAIQRLAYRGKQALRINDYDDEETFDAQFPPDIANNEGAFLKVNAAGDGFDFGPTEDELLDSLLPTPTEANEVLNWSGAAWQSTLRGGGMKITITQDIAGAGQITPNNSIQQLLKVQGDSGSQTASTSPFNGIPDDGTIITLLGMSASNVLKIPYSDTDYGCMLKGDAYLGLYESLTLVYDATDKRYWELARN